MSSSATPERSPNLTIAGLCAATLFLYSGSLLSGFNADDYFILARVKALHGLASPLAYFGMGFFEFFRPLAFLSHALDWQIWGPNAFGFHATNVVLHTVNTLLVFFLGRRFLQGRAPLVAALLFAFHPGSHEAVYWIAARFDLLATLFTLLALLLLSNERTAVRAAGRLSFALGLLSKESAVSLLILAPAWDVWIARRDVRSVIRRWLPLVVVAFGYAALRSFATTLEPAGGSRRVAKLAMTGLAIAGVLVYAWLRDRRTTSSNGASGSSGALSTLAAIAVACAAGFALWLPVTTWQTAEKLGFVAYVAFYSLSPVVLPSPSPNWFSPITRGDAIPGLVAVFVIALAAIRWRRHLISNGPLAFLVVLTVAALIPVSSMVGGLRYLYLPSAGVALLAAAIIHRLPSRFTRTATLVLALLLGVSAWQVLAAGRAWRANADLTRDGITLMAASIDRCGETDVVLVTAPVGQGDVYGNFYWEAFDVLTGCSPRAFTAVLRVLRSDASIQTSRPSPDTIELRVPNYAGNIAASADLQIFGPPIAPGSRATFDTPAGRIATFAEGTTQVFRINIDPAGPMARARLFYFSAGAIHPLDRTP